MKLVEIPIRRFQAEAPLSRDTFLFLPLNNKAIRIALAGEVIPEAMLAKILAKGYTHLRIAEDSEVDPEVFAVHTQSPEAHASADSTSNGAPLEALPAAPMAAEEVESAITISPESPVEEPASVLAAESAEAEAATTIAPSSAPEEPSQAFRADAGEEESSKIGLAEISAEDEVRLEAGEGDEDPESRFGAATEEEDGSQTVSGADEAEEKYVRKFAAEKEALPAVIRLQKKMAEAKEELSVDLSAEKELALKEARTVILSSKISEKIISLSEQSRTAEPSLRESLRGQVRGLKNALDQVDAGDLSLEEKPEFEAKEEISAVVESLASASRAEQVEEISERLSAHALTRELAMSALDEQESMGEKELARSATSRDLPATVSRLAAYLGHSLGYTNVDFLADLGCGAIAHFAKKEGETLNEELLPPFTKRIISMDSAADDATSDSREILQFLDAYIADKECDRSHKDLMKRVFDRTMQDLSEKEDGPSPWSLKKWSSFVDRGPTMDSHSICTRAAAKAVKQARSASK
jgi:hypothetical protein